jgi:hypothetical protein
VCHGVSIRVKESEREKKMNQKEIINALFASMFPKNHDFWIFYYAFYAQNL